ncbi:hypothetical protein D9756_004271 [Leucocoprinus leucothites]|uniref:Uncharacterized protein n=1 Tax=Leucocoprinus leucothites TaxID=201217 RepID=A0A8H5G0Y4_9AGAR|nr:hypothetical protein D9756_004271 [Leucoagaricus leucothites]
MARPREAPPRLHIPPSLNAQQPIGGPGMFSPALPTALQQGFHPPFPVHNAMQTPMQPFFNVNVNPPPPQAHNRPTHHPNSASMAHLAVAGIHPPNGFPMTPVSGAPGGGHFSRPSLMLGPGQLPPFPHRRRQPSIGGPPKAVLGGPARKLSPIPPGASISPAPPTKLKKVVVNLPKETIEGEDGSPPTRQPWARSPIPLRPGEGERNVDSVELITREVYPPDAWRRMMPEVVDVFLPGKAAWDEMKQQAMEEKLERLGVERGSGSNVPHIFAPHARAASVSSPADPNILLYKLNQLQRSREGSTLNSLNASPQPPFGLSPSPGNRSTPSSTFAPPRHGHTMSLAPGYLRSPYEEASSNPFGHDALLGHDQPQPGSPYLLENAPPVQIRTNFFTNAPPPPLSAVQPPENRPDFIRGFGLDIPEEEEPEEEEVQQDDRQNESDGDVTQDMDIDEDGEQANRSLSHQTSPFQSKSHSRHVSKFSTHLSLGSFGGSDLAPSILHKGGQDSLDVQEEIEKEASHVATDDVGEWTATDSSDYEESIGEWSNPSDEERARRERIERRLRRRAAKLNLDKPRRIPNFPRPPDITAGLPSLTREGDMVSNPSEENLMLGHQPPYIGVDPAYLSPGRSSQVLPHSRSGSAPYSVHDPAQAHSRTPSEENFVYPAAEETYHEKQISLSKRDLNPFAKPFVFGGPLASSSPIRTPNDSVSHSRAISFSSKPLNVSAPEFKPGSGGFTFRPPPGVPQMPIPVTASPFPKSLPPPPRDKEENSPFYTQGREKRQRRGSTASMEEGDSMASFKFPRDVDSPRGAAMKRSTSYSGAHSSVNNHGSINRDLNPSAEPFTFAGFSAVARLPHIDPVPAKELASPEELTLQGEMSSKAKGVLDVDVDAEGDDEGDGQEFSAPSSAKKRAPIPLDFKHPVGSNNTVPAGLFKALANEDRTRRTVRSRLSSREIFEPFRKPSMDDNDVPAISHARAQRHTFGSRDHKAGGSISDDDVFGTNNHHHSRRRSSLPDNLADLSSVSQDSVPAMDLTSKMELHRIEHVIGEILEVKFAELRKEIAQNAARNGSTLNPNTEAQIADVISLFRTQLQESAARSLEDAQMDARGEMDFQLIRDVVEEGQKELLSIVRHELSGITAGYGGGGIKSMQDIQGMMEGIGSRVIGAIRESISDLGARQEAIAHAAPARERDALVDKLATALSPMLSSIRNEPLDYEFLTNQLAQAVKPHITQLIDLASDKRETAGLIVENLLPLLPSMREPVVDTDAITLQLITEVRKAIAPIDAFEIKEQVADLVVERLDSRLAVRDKAFSVETIVGKVNESVEKILAPSQVVPGKLESLVEAQNEFKATQEELGVGVKKAVEVVEGLPARFDAGLEGVASGQKEVLSKLEVMLNKPREKDEDVLEVKTLVEALNASQKEVTEQNGEALALSKDVLSKVQAIPDAVTTATAALQAALTDVIKSRDSTTKELEDLRKANADYQVQLAKARSAHGQVRVEKDVMSEKLAEVETERERLRVQVKDHEKTSAAKAAETSTLEARNAELEEALSKALSRLQAADVASQSSTDRIAELEKFNVELVNSRNDFESKVTTLEMQVQLEAREKDSTTRALEVLQKQYDELQSQQTHWNELRQAAEKIDLLTNLIGQADNEELQELRRYREQSRLLEADHNNLQKRFKELENHYKATEKNLASTRQALTHHQQKVTEVEHRAREAEGQLEAVQTKLDQAEQTHAQLDADYSLVRLQLEEREAEERAAKDREARMRETINALESKVRTIQAELEKRAAAAKTISPIPNNITATPPASTTPNYRNNNTTTTNGFSHTPSRPDSRASTVHTNRSATPTRRASTYTVPSVTGTTPPQPSVWDSMHAPRGSVKHPSLSSVHAPIGRYPSSVGLGRGGARNVPSYRSNLNPVRQPSPAMSVASNAPTLGEDGWWE